MEPFKLNTVDGRVLTGIHNIPAGNHTTGLHRPLIIGLHGGSYDSGYYDVGENHTAAFSSNGLGVAFVAIDRPCYGGTSSLYPIPDGSSFSQELGYRLHKEILPSLWDEFGRKNSCNCIVLDAHSLGVAGAVVAAAMYSQQIKNTKAATYHLGGVIISGFGTRRINLGSGNPLLAHATSGKIEIPIDMKDELMLPAGSAAPEVYRHSSRLNKPMPLDEILSAHNWWLQEDLRSSYTSKISTPVMIGIPERDCFWEPTPEHLSEFMASFPASPRVEGSIISGAPHCVELSHWSCGWYARCLGFALECAASFGDKMRAEERLRELKF